MNLMTQIAEDLAAQVKHKEDKHMIKRDIVETVYEYDKEGKLVSKIVTETHEEDTNRHGGHILLKIGHHIFLVQIAKQTMI